MDCTPVQGVASATTGSGGGLPSVGSRLPGEGPRVPSIPAPCLPEAYPDLLTPDSQSPERGRLRKGGELMS